MARHTDAKILRLGAITLVALLIVDGRGLQPAEVPRVPRHDYHAEFIDASGLHVGNKVQVAGIRVGRVSDIRISGTRSWSTSRSRTPPWARRPQAAVQVLNLLGEKYLELTPIGSGELEAGGTIPVSRTDVTSTSSARSAS